VAQSLVGPWRCTTDVVAEVGRGESGVLFVRRGTRPARRQECLTLVRRTMGLLGQKRRLYLSEGLDIVAGLDISDPLESTNR
jgi:hypothetical protein